MKNSLSNEAKERIENLSNKVSREVGYTKENMTYKEILQTKYKSEKDKLNNVIGKYQHKFSNNTSNKDFVEEIKIYLEAGLIDLMKEGYSEEEALKITEEKFDEMELDKNFDEFMMNFNHFNLDDYYMNSDNLKTQEAIGLFYAGFVILGSVCGGIMGYLEVVPETTLIIGIILGMVI